MNNLLISCPIKVIEDAEHRIGGPFDADAVDDKIKALREIHSQLVSDSADATETAKNEVEQEDLLVDAAEKRLAWIGLSRLREFISAGREVTEYSYDLMKDMVRTITVYPDHFIVDFGSGIEALVKKDTARWPVTVRHFPKKNRSKAKKK